MRKKFRTLSLLALLVVAGCNKPSEPSKPSTPGAVSETAKPTDKSTEKPTTKPTEKPTDKPTVGPSATVSKTQETIVVSGLKYVTEGESVTLTSTVEGVTWTSSDTTVATIENGVVTAVKAGRTTITAHKDGYKDGTFTINVLDPVKTVGKTTNPTSTDIHYKTKGVVLAKGKNGFILADKSGRENSVYAYGSANAKKVNTGDFVYAEGTIENGDFGYEYKTTKVQVLSAEYTKPVIENTPVIITPDILDGYDGKGIIYGIVKDGKISESSSGDKKYTNVDFPDGVGKTNKFSFDIAYSYKQGVYDVYGYLCAKTKTGDRRNFIAEDNGLKTPSKGEPTKITVETPNGETNIGKGETRQLSASVEPYYATKEVTWTVTGSDKATIDENGLLTIAEDATTATLTITAKTKFTGGTKTGTLTLALVDKTITIKTQDLVTVGETINLSATLSGEETPAITYSVDNTELAQIVDGNKLKGIKAGEVKLIAHQSGYPDSTVSIDVLDTITAAKTKANGAEVTLKGVVKASDNTGYILADATDYVYVFGNYGLNNVKTGERIKLVGTVAFDSTQKCTFELKPKTTTKLDETEYQPIKSTYTATEMDKAGVGSLTIAEGAKFVTIKSVSAVDNSLAIGEKSVKVVGTTIENGFFDVTGFIYPNNEAYYRFVTETKAAVRPAATALSFKLGTKANINLGSTLTLEVEQTPYGAKDELNWAVSENAHATVSEGVVTLTTEAAVGDTFTITATSKTNAEVKASIELTVVAAATEKTVAIQANEFTATDKFAIISETLKGVTFNVSSGIATSEYLNVYKNQKITISSESFSITKIVITCTVKGTSKGGPGCLILTSDKGTYTATADKTGTWEFKKGTNSISFKAASNQCRIASRSITYLA